MNDGDELNTVTGIVLRVSNRFSAEINFSKMNCRDCSKRPITKDNDRWRAVNVERIRRKGKNNGIPILIQFNHRYRCAVYPRIRERFLYGERKLE